MVETKMVDIVDLRIEAENLASERLVQVANDVQGLGRTANTAQERLDQLEITRRSLDTFVEARQRIDQLEEEVAQASVEYQTLQRELRNTSNATDDQRLAVQRQQLTLRGLRSDLTRTNTEYRGLRESLRAVGVNTQAFRQEQERLATETAAQRVEAQRLTDQYDLQTDRLREQINVQREARVETERQEQAQQQLRQEQERAGAAAAQQLSATRRQTEEQGRLTIATSSYERELQRLANAQAQGNITRGQYIRAEANLRRQLQLTGSQVDTTRRAIEADTQSKLNNARSTDALTSVTRRLAQAYTVLIAAQTAAQSAIGNVQAYGALEAAITNVERTTGIARTEVVALADEIRSLGEDVTPTSSAELLRFAEIAGQLGTTSTEDILSLVNAAEQLGVATNIAGDEAATLLSRILQSTGEGIPAIGNLSSSVVELGNNFAAREDEIVNFTREIVTATRDINLSSAAAAGLGTTLAVAGQRAEASRTAISRLSQAIRRAGTEGGESLQQLANITGQTTDELEANLGTRSEQIILDFVRGLARVQEQGGVTLDTLRQFGIDGQEAAGVFNGLTAQVDTLASALDSSANAYRDGLAQVREASNVYANQESAIGRLSNQFTVLREEIGRAYSNETNDAINLFSDAIQNSNEGVIELFEILPDLVAGVGELGDSFDGLFETFGTDGGGAISAFVDSFTAGLNVIQFSVDGIIGSIQQFTLDAANLANVFGADVDTTTLTQLEEAVDNTRDRLQQSTDDIIAAGLRLRNESSRSYEDLIETVNEYGGAVARLSEEEQIAIDQIINKTGFVDGENQLYRELTASIIRANRAQQIESEQIARINSQRAEDVQARQQQITAIANTTQALTDQIAINSTLDESQARIQERMTEIQRLESEGLIDKETAANLTEFLTANLNLQAEAQAAVNETQTEQLISIDELLARNEELNAQFEAGTITREQLAEAQAELTRGYTETIDPARQAAQAIAGLTDAQINTRTAIDRSVLAIRALNRELADASITEEQRLRLNNELAESERELANLREEQATQDAIASANITQLNRLREVTELQLQRLNEQFRQGIITVAEYEAAQGQLQSTLDQIASVTDSVTAATEENTRATLENAAAKGQQAAASQEVQQFVSLELQAYQRLNQEFDFTNEQTSTLSARIDELSGFIAQNNTVQGVWFRNLARVTNQGLERERSIIRETLAVREYTTAVQSGNLSLEELDRISRSTQFNIRNLGDEQLRPLRDAIAEARREFQELDDTINDALSDTQDRLDRIRGDEAAIVTRQFARERAELDELLEQALVAGNDNLVRQIRQAITNLQQAQRAEFDAQFNNNNAATNTNQFTSSANTQNNTGANRSNGGTITVNINTPTGPQQVQVADQASADALISTLGLFGTVSSQGNV